MGRPLLKSPGQSGEFESISSNEYSGAVITLVSRLRGEYLLADTREDVIRINQDAEQELERITRGHTWGSEENARHDYHRAELALSDAFQNGLTRLAAGRMDQSAG